MICVTGARGTVGREVVRQLEAAGAPFRVACFSPTSEAAARARGLDVVSIDYSRPETLRAGFDGCDVVFLLGPNLLDQTALEIAAVDAAKAAGVKRIVKQSVMGAANDDYSLAHVHRPVERALESSGLAWTFLRPNSFMQNVLTFMKPTIQAQLAFYSASGDARISHIDVRDIAAVAVRALTDAAHAGRAYTLTGPDALTYDEMAEALSTQLGRPIAHVSLAPDELKGAMLGEGMPEPLADRMLDLERYFREGRASVVTTDVERVIGRPATPFSSWLRDHATLL
jgi:uncharacterized protein YbjT (DUF2867 family)